MLQYIYCICFFLKLTVFEIIIKPVFCCCSIMYNQQVIHMLFSFTSFMYLINFFSYFL